MKYKNKLILILVLITLWVVFFLVDHPHSIMRGYKKYHACTVSVLRGYFKNWLLIV